MSPDDVYRPSKLSARCIFLTVTLAVTATASGFMVLALMTDHWEYIDFDRDRVQQISTNSTQVEWLMESHVARLNIPPEKVNLPLKISPMTLFTKSQLEKQLKQPAKREKRDVRTVYLVPMYGGIWTICTNLNGKGRS